MKTTKPSTRIRNRTLSDGSVLRFVRVNGTGGVHAIHVWETGYQNLIFASVAKFQAQGAES